VGGKRCAAPARRARGGAAALTQGGALPPPEEVKWLKPPRRKVSPPMRAPTVNVEDAYFSVKMLYQAWQSLKKMAAHIGVQRPPEPLQTTVMDYSFKVNVLAGHLEREVVPPPRRRRWRPRRLQLRLRLRWWGSSSGDYLCLINLFLY
jgi:hypothetical protein